MALKMTNLVGFGGNRRASGGYQFWKLKKVQTTYNHMNTLQFNIYDNYMNTPTVPIMTGYSTPAPFVVSDGGIYAAGREGWRAFQRGGGAGDYFSPVNQVSGLNVDLGDKRKPEGCQLITGTYIGNHSHQLWVSETGAWAGEEELLTDQYGVNIGVQNLRMYYDQNSGKGLYPTLHHTSTGLENTGWSSYSMAGLTIRSRIKAANMTALSHSGKCVIELPCMGNAVHIVNCFIGHRNHASGQVGDAQSLTCVTFENGNAGIVLAANINFRSDPVDFTWDGVSDVIISMYIDAGSASTVYRGNYGPIQTSYSNAGQGDQAHVLQPTGMVATESNGGYMVAGLKGLIPLSF